MPSEKDRLYVGLYARDVPNTYHWALVVGPKKESSSSRSRRFHVKNTLALAGDPPTVQPVWRYEEVDIPTAPTTRLLVRVLVAKIKSTRRLRHIFEGIAVHPELEGWTCKTWVQDAFQTAVQDRNALGSAITDWETVRDTALWYVDEKCRVGRFDAYYNPTRAPTWDMIKNTELVP